MSDSEYESAIVESRISKSERRNPALIIRSDSEAENGTRRDQAKTSKKKSNNRAPSKSDSEDDQPSKRSKAKTTKRKSTTSRSSKTATPKRRNTKKEEDLFGLVSEDEEDAAHANASRRAPSSQLPSSISSKVADGSVLRRAQLSGRYYAELHAGRARHPPRDPLHQGARHFEAPARPGPARVGLASKVPQESQDDVLCG
ncbi:uncharacterized protein LOC135085881 [Ostrinia nubilalis]|uniref:uncharacterized protein LOC135085881 n=1 Tax=Ostrinia nubilalis TaxID=29057 RepID=UPI0030825ACB